MLMRGTTPPTMLSPPHQSRPTENPPNLQPATVGKEEERGGRDPTSRRTSIRAASVAGRHRPRGMRRSPAAAPATPPAKERSPQGADPRQGEGGQRRRRIAATRHTAGCGPRPCPAPDAARPAAAAPHDTSPDNNNRPEEMRTSCRQQPAPPLRDAAKMSPRISICPEPVISVLAETKNRSQPPYTPLGRYVP